ncbi:DISARM anti-phage system protein DrmE domain-containing protein [Actinomadura geliboluensis]
MIVDAANEPDEFVRDAVAWATACGATPVVFVNVVRRLEPPQNTVVHACGWSAILAASPSVRDPLATLATVRGHAAVLDAGTRPGLAATAALLADARRHGPFPSSLLEAAVLWRRLSELVVPVTGFDAACPRWFTPTLSERLNDLAAVRASDFPRGWRTWAETCWAAVKEGLASARDGLDADNTKARLLVEAIDADLRAGLSVDVALPSRVARDALIQNLAEAGVLTAIDGRLSVRSLADPESWAPRRATLLVAPPTVAQRHRLVAGDIGPLNVLCYAHEVRPLRRMLVDVLDEPLAPQGPVRHLLPSALDVSVDLPGRRPAVVIAIAAADTGHDEKRTTLLAHLADAVDIAGLDALRDASDDTGLDELPEAEDGTATVSGTTTLLFGQARSIAAVPLTVVVTGGTEPLIVHVPAQGTILRLLMGSPRRMAVLDVAPGMLITALDGVSPFERLRPLLVETRGPVTRMLLTAWDQAVDEALQRVGGPAALARALARDGGDVTASAVAKWVDENRIGPRDAKNVARVGKLAHHPVVADNATAIAEVMRRLRALHHVVGRVVADPNDLEGDAANELERLLGPDAVSIAAQTVIYQVRAVDAATTVDQCELYQVRPVVDTGDYRREEKGDRRS